MLVERPTIVKGTCFVCSNILWFDDFWDISSLGQQKNTLFIARYFYSFNLILELHLLLHFGQIHTRYLIKFRVKFTKCQAHFVFMMMRRSDNIQVVSVWNDDDPSVEGSTIRPSLHTPLQAKDGHRDIQQIFQKVLQTETETWSAFPSSAWSNFELCIHVTSRAYNSGESLASRRMSQGVRAAPRRAPVLVRFAIPRNSPNFRPKPTCM